MKKIKMKWECPACLKSNGDEVTKPSVLTPTVNRVECYSCGSYGLMKVAELRDPDKPSHVSYNFAQFHLTDEGQEKFNARQPKIENPQNAEQPKGI